MMARTAETVAELIATENAGSYVRVTPPRLHESFVPVTRREALREGSLAYLLSASGTVGGYTITARAFDGNTYTIRRSNTGSIVRNARVCGKQRHW